MNGSVRPSVCLSVRPSVTPFLLCSHHRIIMKFSGVITNDKSDVHAKGQVFIFKVIRQIARSHGSKNRRFWPKLGVSRLKLQSEFTNGYEMRHKAWSSIEEVPYCFSRLYVKFQGYAAKKIDCDPNWAFPDCNSSLNSLRDLKWCTKLDVV